MSIRRSVPWLCVIPLLLCPLPAFAAGGGGDSSAILLVLALATAVAVAYLLTHFVVDWLQRLFLVATSIEYLALGILVGLILFPEAAFLGDGGWLRENTWLGRLPMPSAGETFALLAPLIALAAGWIGLLYGMALDVGTLFQRRDGALRLALLEGVLVLVPVAAASYGIMLAFAPAGAEPPTSQMWLCAGVLGTTAWAGSTSAMDVVRRRYNVVGEILTTLVRSARFSDMLAILVFGVLFATFHDLATPGLVEEAPVQRLPTPVEWSVISLGLGAGLGLLFAWYLDEDDSDTGTLLALVGIIAFASGAAYFLELSEITINLVLGMVLVNVSRSGAKVRRTLQGTYKPMSLLLLLLAGFLWDVPPLELTAVLTIAVIAIRLLGKVAASWVASMASALRPDLARGLIGQGDVAIAMAITFKLVYDIGLSEFDGTFSGGLVEAAYTAILIGVTVHEIVAPRVLKGLLVDAGEIRDETVRGG
ncbi:MAG: hypothetical protein AB8H79_17755 [Myxococcota bacterium]